MPLEFWCVAAGLVLFLPPIVATIWVQSRERRREVEQSKTPTQKRFERLYYLVLAVAFFAGGMMRVIQQSTGSQWFDGFVPVFGGIFVALWGVPFFYWAQQNPNQRIRMPRACLAGLLFVLAGLGVIRWGISELLLASR